MKQFKININDLFEKSEVETMMDDVEKSSIIYEMNNINQKVLSKKSVRMQIIENVSKFNR